MAHSRIAEELESSFPAAERRVQRLAHHYASARALGYVEQAVRYLAQAAEMADRSLAYADAAGLYQRAASIATLPQRKDGLRLQAARCYLLATDFGRARELSEQVIATGDPRQRLQAAILYETASFRPGREGYRAVQVLTGALREIPGDPADALYIRGIASLGRAVAFTGEPGQARSLGDEAIALARSLGDKDLLASTLDATLFHPYRPADLAELLEQSRRADPAGLKVRKRRAPGSGRVLPRPCELYQRRCRRPGRLRGRPGQSRAGDRRRFLGLLRRVRLLCPPVHGRRLRRGVANLLASGQNRRLVRD